MKLEDKFNQTVWKVLKKIKEAQLFYGLKDNPIIYRVFEVVPDTMPIIAPSFSKPSVEEFEEEVVLRKLFKLGVITLFEFDSEIIGYKINVNEELYNQLFEAFRTETGFFDYKNGEMFFRVVNAGATPQIHFPVKKKQELNEIQNFEVIKSGNYIWVNNQYLISKPFHDMENLLVFDYLYKHPNKDISKVGLEKEIKTKITKRLTKIVTDLGFKGQIRKCFFPRSSNSNVINFRKSVTKEDLKLYKINLELLLKELEIEHFKRIQSYR